MSAYDHTTCPLRFDSEEVRRLYEFVLAALRHRDGFLLQHANQLGEDRTKINWALSRVAALEAAQEQADAADAVPPNDAM